jgi:hypothetical protein
MTLVARSFALAAVAVAAAVLSGCATGPEIRRETNPAADFSAYRSFAFFSPLATDREGYESVLSARLKAATRRNLEAKGYVYSEAEPDLKVNFYANVEDKQEIRSMPVGFGYYAYRRGFYTGLGVHDVETVNYQEGTLTIDLVDPRQKSLVWSATAEGRVSREARQNPGPAIDAVVDDMLAPLPGPGRM